jgi:thioredoxin reductase
MSGIPNSADFDVAIIGGGPAGLSAAVVLARACRRVVLFDHGKPRNYAARAIHGFLGQDGVSPGELRDRGRKEARNYGVEFHDGEVTSARALSADGEHDTYFEITIADNAVTARAVLLATGMTDYLPKIPGLRELYGKSVHHCPYCDGWEHRGKHLVALASGSSAVKLAHSLRVWSPQVTACSNGKSISDKEKEELTSNGVDWREEKVSRLVEDQQGSIKMSFDVGSPLNCDAIFFGGDQGQRSPLAKVLGCETDEDDLIQTYEKQRTCVEGVFVAGDAAGDVQFAIVAAAEGAIAAVAINHMLQEQDVRRTMSTTSAAAAK